MRFSCIFSTRLLWRWRRKHYPPDQPESVGIESGKEVQLEQEVQDKQQQYQQEQVQEETNQDASESGRNICDTEIDHSSEVTRTDSGTINALDPEAIEHANNAVSEAPTGPGTPESSPTDSEEAMMAVEDSPIRETPVSIPEEPVKEERTMSRVMELVREREASCKARTIERKESTATLSPGLAALRQRKKVDISAWDRPSLMTRNVSNRVLLQGNRPDNQVRGNSKVTKDLETSRRVESYETARIDDSQRMETPEPSSPTVEPALDRREGVHSMWGGDTSSPSVSSVDGASSPDSENSPERSMHRSQDSKPIKLVWPPHVENNTKPGAGNGRIKNSSLKWGRTGSLVNSEKNDVPVKAMVRGLMNDGANEMAVKGDQAWAPSTRKNRGPKGGPFDEEEILKWIQKVTGLDIDPECGVHYSLKDGVALCRLMAVLRPDIEIAEPNDSPVAYKQMANICIFLQACRALGLPESILFDAADLQQERNIPKVVVALVTLGEMVPLKCPAFAGPKLNVAVFSWTPCASGKGKGQGHGSRSRAAPGSNGTNEALRNTDMVDPAEEQEFELTDEMISNVFHAAVKSSPNEGLNSRQFASLWRSLSGGKENFFYETKMFKKFNVAEDGAITLEEFVDGVRELEQEDAQEYDEVLYNIVVRGDS